MRAEELLDRLGGLPGVVVRDLGRDVVRDVGLADAVEDVGADGSHHVAVHRRERAAGEGPLRRAVVGDDRVRVLQPNGSETFSERRRQERTWR